MAIPTIDFCSPNLKPGSAEWESTKNRVVQALEEYGAFEAIYDKIQNEIRQEILGIVQETLTSESKMIEFAEKPYERYREVPRTKYNATRRIADMLLPEGVQTFANTFWPHDGNPHFCKLVTSYTDSVAEFDGMVKRMIFESLGLIDYYDEFMDEMIFYLRFMNYNKEVPEGDDVSNGRLTPHADPGFLTTSIQNRPGLQILTANGDWVNTSNDSPFSYVVLVGDSFMAWTNGRLKSAYHRVKYDDCTTDRLSVILFTTPKPGDIIKAPKEAVDKQHPLLYKPYEITDYYSKVQSGVAYDTRNVLKAFYSV